LLSVVSAYSFNDAKKGPIVSLFCIDADGTPCSVDVEGFVPYFYVRVPQHGKLLHSDIVSNVKGAIREMNKSVYTNISKQKFVRESKGLYFDKSKDPDTEFCAKTISEMSEGTNGKPVKIPMLFKACDVVHKKCFDRFRSEPVPMIKVECKLPQFAQDARRMLASPLGTGRTKDKTTRDLPWLSIKVAASIVGRPYEQAYKYAEVCSSNSSVPRKKPKTEVGNHTITAMFGSQASSSEKKKVPETRVAPCTTQEDWAIQTCETNTDFLMRFFVDMELPPFGWFSMKNVKRVEGSLKKTKFDDEYQCTVSDLVSRPEVKKIPPIKVMSFDIETQPSEKNGSVTQFYRGWDLTAKLLTVGTCIHVTGEDESTWITEVHQLDEGWRQHMEQLSGREGFRILEQRVMGGTEEYYSFCYDHDGVRVTFFGYETERALFQGFLDRFWHHKPQVLTGWNINGYDYEQMDQMACRITMIECERRLKGFEGASKILESVSEYMGGEWVNEEESKFKAFSKSLGAFCSKNKEVWGINMMRRWKGLNFKRSGDLLPNNYRERHVKATNTYRYKMYGVWSLDLYVYCSKELKLRSYKLDYVAKELLNNQKDDMPYSEINSAYNAQGFEGRLKLAMYCAIDCVLVNRLMECKKIQALKKVMFMCMLTNVLCEDLHWKGTQNQLRGAILRYLKDHRPDFVLPVTDEYYVPTWDDGYESDEGDDASGRKKPGYQGATVIDALSGFYTDPVAVFDFASLYPSIIRELNLCNSSILWNKDQVAQEGLTDQDVIQQTIGDQTVFYVDKSKFQGVIPSLLSELKNSRSYAKKEMEAREESDPEYSYWDGLQATVKVLMNGMYGSFGLKKGGIFKDGYVNAALTTQRGRGLISLVKKECEDNFWTHPDGRFGITTSEVKPDGGEHVSGIYGDTDSVFILLKHLQLDKAWEFAATMDKHFEHMLPYPHNLELEKICLPLLLMKKKTYSAVMYMGPEHKGKVVSKGSSVVRRDQVACIQKVTQKTQDMLMAMESKQAIEEYVVRMKRALMDSIRNMWVDGVTNEFPLESFVESGSLSADKPLHAYADGATCAVEVIRRVQRRNPEEVPEGGARVEFVIIRDNEPLVTKRARTIEEVKEDRLTLDEGHYLNVFDKKISSIMSAAYIQEEREERLRKGSRTMEYFFGKRGREDDPSTVPLMPAKKQDTKKEGGRMYVENNVLRLKSTTSQAPRFVNSWDRRAGKWVRTLK
jgi:DNA polymerase elongation subunit (family B)